MTMKEITEGVVAVVETVTPEIAKLWLETMMYERQRPVNKRHVARLAQEMSGGRFNPGSQIQITYHGDEVDIIDGQHRLHAIVNSGTSQIFTITKHYVNDLFVTGKMYDKIDHPRVRTLQEGLVSRSIPERFEMSAINAKLLAAVVSYMDQGCTKPSQSSDMNSDERIQKAEVYAPYMNQFIQLTENAGTHMKHRLFRAATLAVALLTLRFSAPHAESRGDPSVVEFWKGAALDDGIKIGDPRKLAYTHLWKTVMHSPRSSTDGTSVTAAFSSRYLINCFHGYIKRRNMERTTVQDQLAPIVIYGVPTEIEKWWE